MDRRLHTMRMRETADCAIPRIVQVYHSLAEDRATSKAMSLFVDRRTNPHQPLLRPYLVRLAYEICEGTDWRSIAPACAAVEVLNISSYQANVAFDGKLTVSTQEDRAKQFGCAMISLDCARKLLGDINSNAETTLALVEGMQRANREMYVGQMMDLTELQLENITTASVDSAIGTYKQRCKLLGGSLTSWCLSVGGQLAGAGEERLELLEQIGMEMGVAGQMVNDVGDYVPILLPPAHPQSLRYQHPFSDILNGKATYPILHAFKVNAASVIDLARRIFAEQIKEASTLNCLANELNRIRAFDATRLAVRKHYKAARRLLDAFPPSRQKAFFCVALTTLTHNKYFTSLHESRSPEREAVPARKEEV